MTVQDASRELNLSEQRIRILCKQGRLGMKLGRQWVITRDEIEAFKKIERPPHRPRKDQEEE